jgi:hypothetical protein
MELINSYLVRCAKSAKQSGYGECPIEIHLDTSFLADTYASTNNVDQYLSKSKQNTHTNYNDGLSRSVAEKFQRHKSANYQNKQKIQNKPRTNTTAPILSTKSLTPVPKQSQFIPLAHRKEILRASSSLSSFHVSPSEADLALNYIQINTKGLFAVKSIISSNETRKL